MVFQQSPGAGKTAKPTTTIVLTISLGAGSEFPPNVVGLSADEAEKSLKERGFGVQRVSQASIDVAEGLVISQDPTTDRQLQKGKPVLIRVSTGGQEITMPQCGQSTDRSGAQATHRSQVEGRPDRARHPKPSTSTASSAPTLRAGKTREGARVTVVVSDGFPKVEMPDVVNLTQDAATSVLTGKGLARRGRAADPAPR